MRCVEEIYGTNHFLTKKAHQELLRIRAEEAASSTVPFHEQLRSLGLKLHKMEGELSSHSALVHQAETTHRKATTRLAHLATTTAEITAKIHTIKAENDLLVANYTPDDATQKTHTNTAGLAELMLFLDETSDTETPDTMAWIRKEVVELARQIHMGTQISDSSDLAGWEDLNTYGPSFIAGTHGPSKQIKSTAQDHTDDAYSQYQNSVCELTEAKTASISAKQAFFQATELAQKSPDDSSLRESMHTTAQAATDADASELWALDKEDAAYHLLQSHTNHDRPGPYGR
jgi:hypothetical protein